MTSDIIDLIYECAFMPDRWMDFLDELVRLSNAPFGALIVNGRSGTKAVASDRVAGLFQKFLERGNHLRSERTQRINAVEIEGFIREQDFFTDAELEADPLYRDFLHPLGFGYSTASIFNIPTGERISLSVERERVKGPLEDALIDHLNVLRPHIARSAAFASRLQLQQVQAATEALSIVGLPCLAFDDDGRALVANDLIQSGQMRIHWRSNEHFALADTQAEKQLRVAIDCISRRMSPQTSSIIVRSDDGLAANIAHVIPVQRSARDLFNRCAGIMMLVPVTMAEAPPVELVRSLFDLTPAEAQVARRLTAGDSVEDISRHNGVSVATVRTQVQKVLEKTGSNRQSEIISLLAGLRTFPDGSQGQGATEHPKA